MRLFSLTPSLIGSINHKIFLLTNRQVDLMGLILFNFAAVMQECWPAPNSKPEMRASVGQGIEVYIVHTWRKKRKTVR